MFWTPIIEATEVYIGCKYGGLVVRMEPARCFDMYFLYMGPSSWMGVMLSDLRPPIAWALS